jgi:serine/threonine protein kinase
VAMASFNADGVFAADHFEMDIRRMQGPEDLIRDVTSVLDPSRTNGTRWFRIDGSFNGIQLQDFKYLCMLGEGGYGSVHLLAEKTTGVPYAIKAIELKQESKLSKMIQRECIILQMLQHPNVVNMKYSFRNHNRLFLVLSYVRGGNLKQIVERDHLEVDKLVSLFAELVLALDYIHSMGVIHRDVKPANCMIGEFWLCIYSFCACVLLF